MEKLPDHARAKAGALTASVTSDSRWDLQNELMCQVFSFTAYGYIFGIGRVECFMDVDEIHAVVLDQLTGLGMGRKYAEGLIDSAHKEFITENNLSVYSKLIGIGHSHALQEDLGILTDSIFINTKQFERGTHRPWWKFWG